LETQGPLGTLWAGIGLMAFYIALAWANLFVLPIIVTPLFIIPLTWLMDKVGLRKRGARGAAPTTPVTHVTTVETRR
jgi:hypothetical protein